MEPFNYPKNWQSMSDSRRLRSKKTVSLYCFSPEVMIFTAGLETLLLVYLLFRRKTTQLFRLILWTLFCLAIFQYVEYYACVVGPNSLYVRIGMVAISFLPALGFNMVDEIARGIRGVRLGYGIAVALAIGFLLFPGVYIGSVCTGNYLIINVNDGIGHVFGAYYFLFLFWALTEGFRYLNRSTDLIRRKPMTWLMVGYVSFMFPMAVVYSIDPMLVKAIPSVMCGFAVILAIILALCVAPFAHQISD